MAEIALTHDLPFTLAPRSGHLQSKATPPCPATAAQARAVQRRHPNLSVIVYYGKGAAVRLSAQAARRAAASVGDAGNVRGVQGC